MKIPLSEASLLYDLLSFIDPVYPHGTTVRDPNNAIIRRFGAKISCRNDPLNWNAIFLTGSDALFETLPSPI
jgi:hypothetical protein